MIYAVSASVSYCLVTEFTYYPDENNCFRTVSMATLLIILFQNLNKKYGKTK